MTDIPKGWVEATLGENYDISSGLSKNREFFGYGNTFISYKDVFNNWFIPAIPAGLVDSNIKEQQTCSIKKGDVLLTRTSETVGDVGMSSVALIDYPKSTFNGFCKRLRPKSNPKVDFLPLYIGYLLRTRNFRKTVIKYATITTRASLNGESIKRINLVLPTFNEQKFIATILSSLDNKIDNLRKQNETLEQIAQTLFKQWFVEFEFPYDFAQGKPSTDGKPYKSSGGKMIESELGEIPEGWRVGKLEDEFRITMGQSPKGTSYNENGEGTVFYQGRIDFGFRFPTVRLYTTEPKRMAEPLDVLVSVRAPVGDINVAFERCCIGLGLSAVSSEYKSYCLHKLKSFKRKFDVFEQEGSVFGSLNKENFNNMESIIPSSGVVNAFETVIKPIDDKVLNNSKSINSLSETRDKLLPKLMSGEIRVK